MEESDFWSHVVIGDECWLWNGPTNHKGYGRFTFFRGRHIVAHWISWLLDQGVEFNWATMRFLVDMWRDGNKWDLDHTCRVRNCVRPTHLELVTHRENIDRGLHGRLRTHCKNGHELTEENTYIRRHKRTGWVQRVCRTCQGEYMAEYRKGGVSNVR